MFNIKTIALFIMVCCIAAGIFFVGWQFWGEGSVSNLLPRNKQSSEIIVEKVTAAQSFRYQLEIKSTSETALEKENTITEQFDCFIDLTRRSQTYFDQECDHSKNGVWYQTLGRVDNRLAYRDYIAIKNDMITEGMPERYDTLHGIIAYFQNQDLEKEKLQYTTSILPSEQERTEALDSVSDLQFLGADALLPGILENEPNEVQLTYRLVGSGVGFSSFQLLLQEPLWKKKIALMNQMQSQWSVNTAKNSWGGVLPYATVSAAFETPIKIALSNGRTHQIDDALLEKSEMHYACSVPENDTFVCVYTMTVGTYYTMVITERFSALNTIQEITPRPAQANGDELYTQAIDLFKKAPAEKQKAFLEDPDADGVSYQEELFVYGTSNETGDTDDDGFTDKQERDNGFNPLGPGKKLGDF